MLLVVMSGCSTAKNNDAGFSSSDDEVSDDDAAWDDDSSADDDANPNDDAVVDDDTVLDDDLTPDDDIIPDDDATPDDDTIPDDDTVPDDDIVTDDDTAPDDDTTPEEYRYSIKVDNMTMADVIAQLPIFVERGLDLFLNIRPWDINDDLLELLSQAAEQNVPVKIWPLLDWDDGSWGCEDDLDLFIANVLATVDFISAVDNNVEWVILNMELGHPKIDQLEQYFADGDWVAIIELLLADRDRELFQENLTKMQVLLDELHDRGFKVQSSTYPYVLDDLPDGDPDIQDIADIPLSGLNWDNWGFNPYTTEYSAYMPALLGPDFVYSYASSAFGGFGSHSEITVGIVPTADEVGYTTLEAFAADVAAAKAAGIKWIGVYHLNGILSQEDPDAWFDALETPPAQPAPQALIGLLRGGIMTADWMLDFIP